ncbi:MULTISPECIES: substrate-binding periplasmic protein [Pseudoalteromonas]|uniref:Transporter substrate-binding domain-containing protein n=1 Tax=Pseudoalteromonas fuliginea TaxID=1872678 RepID=A0ABQ6RDS5_9GAMM|nr:MULTISPECIES: transporter substrate-binding domain-containing protein [Pseudoalteromonas]KAA1150897.1 transporter substrate-binding domain-containing protein [Pseudoalteromonas fuliginea]KAA1165570.1 transporter substrate-binding domain-containing protein [Pseudoalteromonas fuliginea]KDC55774.1 amino acid ABC transporter substrate-binding protein [Pseudoalteromonas sp. S3431]
MKTIIVVFAVLLLSTFNTQACNKTFEVGTNENYWPPYVELKNGVLSGIEINVIKTLFKGSPFCLKFSVLPSSLRAQEELKQGRIDIMFAATKTKKRSKFAYFSQSYRDEVMLLYKNTLSPNLSSIEQLFSQGFSIAVNRGSYYGAQFEQLKKAYPKQVVLISTADKRFEMLNKQRVDFVIEDALSGLFFLKQSLNIEPVTNMAFFNKAPVHLMLSKKTVTLDELSVINQLIQKNKKATERIYQTY